MNHQPQHMYDNMGNKTGVFVPIDEYERFTNASADIPVGQREIDLIKERMTAFRANPDAAMDVADFFKSLDAQDAAA